jgi:prepilin-type N-terminal cleavage/methylation domain-containing protein
MQVLSSRPPAGVRPGFTMVEVLFVVIIVGILLAVAIPRFPVNAARSDAGVRMVRALLQVAQRSAVTRQSSVVVGIDAANHRFRIHDDADNDLTVDAGERVRSEPLQEGVILATPAWGGVNGAVSAPVGGTNLRTLDGLPSVVFRRDGSASSDVELYLSARTGAADSWRAVVVLPSTGRADAWRASSQVWRRMRP